MGKPPANKWTLDRVMSTLADLGYKALEPYPGQVLARWRVVCPNGHESNKPFSQITRTGCNACSGNRRIDETQALELLSGTIFTPRGPYPGAASKLWLMACPSGHEASRALIKALTGSGCSVCSGNSPLSDLDASAQLLRYGFTPLEAYPGKVSAPWLLACSEGHKLRRSLSRVMEGLTCRDCRRARKAAELEASRAGRRRQSPPLSDTEAHTLALAAGYTPQVPYPGTLSAPWHMTCPEGHVIHRPLSAVKKGSACPVCSPSGPVTATQATQVALEHGFTPAEPYPGTAGASWEVICSAGHRTRKLLTRIRAGSGCKECSNHATMTSEQAAAFLAQYGYTSTEPYPGKKKDPWLVTCSSGHTTSRSWTDLARARGGCAVCIGRLNLSHEQAIAILAEYGFTTTEPYPGRMNSSWTMTCKEGHTGQRALAAVRAGVGCLDCSRVRPVTEAEALELARQHQWTPLEPYPGRVLARWRVACPEGHENVKMLTKVRAGQGCTICEGRAKITTEQALASAAEYGFTPLEEYPGGVDLRWLVRCENGHDTHKTLFELRGVSGCGVCAGTAPYTHERATDAIAKYGFTPVETFPGRPGSPWKMRCAKGHVQRKRLAGVMVGSLCWECSPAGFDYTGPGRVYIITHEQLHAHKVGITGLRDVRLASFKSEGWQVFAVLHLSSGWAARSVEKEFFNWLQNDAGISRGFLSKDQMPFGGWTETFSSDELDLATVRRQVQSLATSLDV